MFRILIVEDIRSMLRELAEFLSETLSESETMLRIDTAETVRDARSLIETAYSNKRPYHAVLLDFNLPMDRGFTAEIDESLCLAVRELMPTTCGSYLRLHRRRRSGNRASHENISH